MAKVFVIDVASCNGCYNCQLACKDEHVGNDWTPYAKPQPDIGQFWTKLEETVQGSTPKVKIHWMPKMCNHCDNPSCVTGDGAVYKREDGLVIIDPEKAAGRKDIVDRCPYGAIYWNEELSLAQKCTGCAHLLDGGYSKPRCVESCPHDAITFGEDSELTDLIEGAEVLKPETGCGPRVYYRNVPGLFVAGTAYDPVEEEVLVGATCRLINGGKLWMLKTDEYGDFWFKDLPKGIYDLVIEAPGFKPKTFNGLRVKEALNLGDIPLEAEE
jgi:Fe-S-cluster-containing dehydrogenase component